MWHVTIASTRASVWAAIARLVVLPVFTTHTTHLLMSSLASLMKATHPTRIATVVVVVAEAVVVWASVPWTVVAVIHHPGRRLPPIIILGEVRPPLKLPIMPMLPPMPR